MAEVSVRDALQPALLDRLTDHDPTRQVESREERVITRQRLRELVERDLLWLFNTTNLSFKIHPTGAEGQEVLDGERYPLAAESTLNYGLPPLSGKSMSGVDPLVLERALAQAIRRFEPRILPHSLSVKVSVKTFDQKDQQKVHHNVVYLEIAGELWGQPYPVELLIKYEFDVENGVATIARSDGAKGAGR